MTTASLEERRQVPARPRRRWLRTAGALLLTVFFTAGIVALMLALAGVFEPKVKPPATAAAASAPAGPTVEVQRITRPRNESAIGTIRAIHEVNVASKILARVKEVRVKAGQNVNAHDVLVVLDDADLQARLQQADAAEAAAKARLEQARIDLDRAQKLRERQAISPSELDQASTAFRMANAELERTQRAVQEAKIVVGYATVTAPIGGIIVDKRVNEGDTVSPGQTLVFMYDPEHMQMIATVRESLAMKLEVGQQVPARLDALDLNCRATITEIVPEAQAESRSFQVKVTGPCPPNIYSGMFGRILIPLEDEEVLVVPDEAVRRVGQLDEVLVVADGTAHRHAVQLGRTLPEGREVLSGLKAGEKVVLLRPSAKREGRS